MGDIVPRDQLVKQGVKGVGGVGAGIGTLILSAIASPAHPLPGLIVGAIVGVAGMVIASSREDRNAGLVAMGAGGLTMLSSIPLIGHVVGWLMPVAGVGLIAAGAWSLLNFWRNLRRRSR
jgi:hypothetical protein